MKKINSETGQSLLELVIVITVTIIVITSLVFATLSSLRNAQFAKNQAQATKLAQQGLEKIRSSRDKNGTDIKADYGGDTTNEVNNWDDFWSINPQCAPGAYYVFNTSGEIQFKECQETLTEFPKLNLAEQIEDSNFKRVIIISGIFPESNAKKTFTVIVAWTDYSGTHESRLTTILRKP